MIKSLIPILLFLISFVGNAYSQSSSYTISPKIISMNWDYTEDLDMKAFISTNSMLNQDIEYTVITLDIPAQWQEHMITQFCDVQSCYDFRWFKLGDKKEMKLMANTKGGIMKVDFLLPMDTSITIESGSAEIALAFNVKGQPVSDTLRFLVNRSSTNVDDAQKNEDISLQVLSNQHMSISHAEGISQVMMYDLQGNLIEQHDCGDSQFAILSLKQSSRGAYFLRIKTRDGKEYSKVHLQ